MLDTLYLNLLDYTYGYCNKFDLEQYQNLNPLVVKHGLQVVLEFHWCKYLCNYNPYNQVSFYTGLKQPVNNLSWYEAIQFVNWLNTTTGHPALDEEGAPDVGSSKSLQRLLGN